MPALVVPVRCRRAEIGRRGALMKRHAERAAAGGDPGHLVEGNRQAEIAAPELEHLRLEARLAARRLALETRRARRLSSHVGPWSSVPGSWSVLGPWSSSPREGRAASAEETARSRIAASCVE